MTKIPTIFERDWLGDKSRVIDRIHPGCEWVFAGEGVATRKVDGTSCLVRDGKLYKRREVRNGDPLPADFEASGPVDEETGKIVGWVPVTDAPEDRWHREAFVSEMANGTCELLGPKIQGNPEKFIKHVLQYHEFMERFTDCPRTYNELKSWFRGKDIEGIVFHHPDGRMAKIKQRDFGLKRTSNDG